MKRRDFLSLSILSAASLSSQKLMGGINSTGNHNKNKNHVNYPDESLFYFQEKMENNQLTSVKLTKMYLKRINDIDKNGPKLNSILELNPDALKIAEKMDKIRKEKGKLSPLHGIPILIKGNIDTKDNMSNNAGSISLGNIQAKDDAYIVKKLKDAGAVILGKTNLSEWANFRSTRSSSGWSSVGGQTKNPYSTDRTPCGSSSGSGVAVSANLCTVAIGTETDGSIVCPSGINGIVGIKPTIGLVSRSGIIPISHSQDTAGPMTRTVSEAAALLTVISGSDTSDKVTVNKKHNIDYTKFLNKESLKGSRIGIARQYFGFHEKVDEIMENSIKFIKNAGGIIIDNVQFDNLDQIEKDEFTVLLCEFKDDLNNYLKNSNAPENVNTLAKLMKMNIQLKNKTMPFFQQEIFEMAEKTNGVKDEKYYKALQNCQNLAGKNGIDKVMKENKLDAIIAPTNGPAWKIDLITGDHFLGGSSTLAAVSGYPAITVPAGYVNGLPIGLSFFGKAFDEGKLISYAYSFEQISKVRKSPEYKKSVDI